MPRLSIEPAVSLNWVQLPYGEFTAHLASTRFTVTPSARMLISSLIQWNPAPGRSLERAAAMEYTGGASSSLSTAMAATPGRPPSHHC